MPKVPKLRRCPPPNDIQIPEALRGNDELNRLVVDMAKKSYSFLDDNLDRQTLEPSSDYDCEGIYYKGTKCRFDFEECSVDVQCDQWSYIEVGGESVTVNWTVGEKTTELVRHVDAPEEAPERFEADKRVFNNFKCFLGLTETTPSELLAMLFSHVVLITRLRPGQKSTRKQQCIGLSRVGCPFFPWDEDPDQERKTMPTFFEAYRLLFPSVEDCVQGSDKVILLSIERDPFYQEYGRVYLFAQGTTRYSEIATKCSEITGKPLTKDELISKGFESCDFPNDPTVEESFPDFLTGRRFEHIKVKERDVGETKKTGKIGHGPEGDDRDINKKAKK